MVHIFTLVMLYLTFYIGLFAGRRQGRRHERQAINSMLSRFETALTAIGRRYAVGPTLQTLQYLRTELNRCPVNKKAVTKEENQ